MKFKFYLFLGGKLFILFAPHVGLSDTMQFGHYSRKGQHRDDSTACGAAVGAMRHCLACKPIPTYESLGANPFDYQMSLLISEVSKRIDLIKDKGTENERNVALAIQMYDIAKVIFYHFILNKHVFKSYIHIRCFVLQEFLEKIIPSDFGGHTTLVLLGGIQINMPHPLTGNRFLLSYA
jgi:hypothetical protein